MNLPMRVKVWNGDKSEYLGEGNYVANVPVVAVAVVKENGDYHLYSLSEPNNVPDPLPEGGEIKELPNNPKIVLDSGETVYGCQVWWQPVEDPADYQIKGGLTDY